MLSILKLNHFYHRSGRLSILFLTILVVSMVLVFVTTKNTVDAAKIAIGLLKEPIEQTVDGSTNPELISDQKAYSLLLRLIARTVENNGKAEIRAYARQIGLSTEDAETLMSIAKEFQQRVGALDRQAKQIRQPHQLIQSAQARTQLLRLQEQKEQIVIETINSLSGQLGAEGMNSLRHYVNERFKRQMKILPAKSAQSR
jgi:hypothetical protein